MAAEGACSRLYVAIIFILTFVLFFVAVSSLLNICLCEGLATVLQRAFSKIFPSALLPASYVKSFKSHSLSTRSFDIREAPCPE